MAAFERELASSRACMGNGNGKHARIHLARTGELVRPKDVSIGSAEVDMNDVASVLARANKVRDFDPKGVAAVEVFQLCENAEHRFHPRTAKYDAILERVGAIIIADAVPLELPAQALVPGMSEITNYRHTTSRIEGVRPNSFVQLLSTASNEAFKPITSIVEAAASEPHHEAFVALQGLIGVRIATSQELRG